jgi:tetratricopeptide (TPR) repeat protein
MSDKIKSTIRNVVKIIDTNPTEDLEYQFNKNVFTKYDAIELTNEVENIIKTKLIAENKAGWYYAWLISVNYFLGDYQLSKSYLNKCLSIDENNELSNLAQKFSKYFGFNEYYNSWQTLETDNLIFHYRQDSNSITNVHEFAEKREVAFVKIQEFFKSSIHRKIDFYIWDSRDEAYNFLNRYLGFSIPQYYLIHSAADQSIGHEITHIITHYIEGSSNVTSLICEGAAVLFDQSIRDNIESTKKMMKRNNITQVDIKKLWDDFFKLSSGVTYPLSAVFAQALLTEFGKEKYIELLKNQTYDNACNIYGKSNLDIIIQKTQNIFNI